MTAKNDWFEASCDMEFICPRRWSALKPTKDKDIRFCGECKQNVHLVESEAEFNKQASAGRCVVIITETETEESLVVGIPAMPGPYGSGDEE